MKHILTYETDKEYLKKRQPHRANHFEHIKKYNTKNQIILGGAIGEPVSGVLIIFDGMEQHVIEEFAQQDPYILNGVASNWKVEVWHEVLGS